jgi:hypothetical protein
LNFFGENDIMLIHEIEEFWNSQIDTEYDWFPVIMRAQEDPRYSHGDSGFTLLFGPREYKFKKPIQLIRGMSLIGSGGAGWYAGTVLSLQKIQMVLFVIEIYFKVTNGL